MCFCILIFFFFVPENCLSWFIERTNIFLCCFPKQRGTRKNKFAKEDSETVCLHHFEIKNEFLLAWNKTYNLISMHISIWKYVRRGGGFSKKSWNFSWLLLGRPNWFFELSQITLKTLFWPNFLRRGQLFQKTVQKAFLGTFWKISTKKLRFSARAPALNLVYISAFRKIWRSVIQKWISQYSTKGDHLSRQAVKSLRRGPPPPPPPKKKNPVLVWVISCEVLFSANFNLCSFYNIYDFNITLQRCRKRTAISHL